MSEDLRTIVKDWVSKNSVNPMKFKSKFPEVMILLGYNENDRYASGIMNRLYDWLYEMKAPICENPNCSNTTNFLRFVDGYNRFCCKKCTFSNPSIKAKRNPKRTKEEKEVISKKKKETLDNHTDEEKEEIKKNRILGHAKRTIEEEKARRDAISKFWQDLSEEELAIRQQKTDESKKPERIATLQSRIENHVIPLFSWEEYKGVDHNFEYKFQCKKCNEEFMDDLDDGKIPRCLKCYPFIKGSSAGEQEMYEYVCSLVGHEQIIRKSRTLGKEIDVYVPSKNIGFEYNGTYWHNEEKKNAEYHIDKLKAANDAGITLIQIMDFEWAKNNSAVKNRIRHLLGCSERRSAGKCKIKYIEYSECKDFLNENHTQGAIPASVYLGLYDKEELVSVMIFGTPRFNKKAEWEMIRFSSKYNVVGAASRLFQRFIKDYNPKDIISYADRRYSNNGGIYHILGFTLTSDKIKAGYFYVDRKGEYISRYSMQKKELIKLGYPKDKSAEDIALELHLFKIWDCGQLAFIWKK